MILKYGFKSDPILYRYSYPWLFAHLEELGVRYLQFGTFFEMYRLPDRFFQAIRRQAADHGIEIRSCFTAHRELGGFFCDDPDMQAVAMETYRRFIEIGALLGAESVGSNPGSVLRDRMKTKERGSSAYLEAMTDLAGYAAQCGLKALTVEPMSCLAEPPTTPEEIRHYMDLLAESRLGNTDSTVPVYLCGDTAHGYADHDRLVVNDNMDLFEHEIPWLWEFHLKNTDACFDSTYGFSPDQRESGIVDLADVRTRVLRRLDDFPTDHVIAYLELPGPKHGRDYSDGLLLEQMTESLEAIREIYSDPRA